VGKIKRERENREQEMHGSAEKLDETGYKYYKPGGDRVHVCVMGWKWGLAPVGFWEKK
jgi:hypothetical protein